MTSPELPFSMWGWPGPNASAGIQDAGNGDGVLSIFLDPINLVVSVPPFPGGQLVAARLYRQLARACTRLAAELDPAGEVLRPVGGAHARRDEPADESGAGGGPW
jgi:hypothetical protein